MSFERPWALLLIALPIVLLFWEWRRRGHRVRFPLDHSSTVERPWLNRLLRGIQLLPSLLLMTAILMLSGPRRLAPPTEERVLTNIQFCLDVSGSMTAPFGEGRRADQAIQAIQEFTSHRKGDAFGLTLFGTDVLHWVPITKDLSAIHHSAPFLRPERMPPYMGGTRIGKALREIRKNFLRNPEGDRMIILISDGESSDLWGGQAEEIGTQLAEEKVTVYYIHVADGAPQAETHTIAGLTGGEAYAAGDPAALREVFQKIDSMQGTRLKQGTPEWIDFFEPFSVAGLSLLGLWSLTLFGLRFTPW